MKGFRDRLMYEPRAVETQWSPEGPQWLAGGRKGRRRLLRVVTRPESPKFRRRCGRVGNADLHRLNYSLGDRGALRAAPRWRHRPATSSHANNRRPSTRKLSVLGRWRCGGVFGTGLIRDSKDRGIHFQKLGKTSDLRRRVTWPMITLSPDQQSIDSRIQGPFSRWRLQGGPNLGPWPLVDPDRKCLTANASPVSVGRHRHATYSGCLPDGVPRIRSLGTRCHLFLDATGWS
uniref:Uncharacterized protein n=1 Tax=Steinernema glaseri TaxID=37863 RepID=A0A1I7Z2P9_9BILA